MDGNNRWAKQRGKPGIKGHKEGVERIRDVMRACQSHGVEVLTLFAFSSENWQRPPKEVEALMSLFLLYLKNEAKKLKKEGVRLRVIGSRERFSPKLVKAIEEAETIASEGSATLVIAADYGGQWDVANAARKLAAEVAAGRLQPNDIDDERLGAEICLSDLPPLDMMIRTGGEVRISNFLLWQAAYAELVFSDTLWPDFGKTEIDTAVAEFNRRQRRFGKTSEQIEQGE